jgi:hypothetical protein
MGAAMFTCCVMTFEPGKLMVKSAYYDNDGRKGQTDALAERRQESADELDFSVTLTATEYETM